MRKAIAFFIGAVLAAQTASAAYLTWQVWIESGSGVVPLQGENYTAHLIASTKESYDRFHRGQDSENHENEWFKTVGDTATVYTDGSQTASFGVTADLSNYSSGYYFYIELWAGNHVAYVNSETGTNYADLPGLVGSMSVPTAGSDAFQMTTATSVPEPATAGLLLIGLGLAGLRRKVRS